MNINNSVLKCPVCDFEYNHLIGTIHVSCDADSYTAQKLQITLSGNTYEIKKSFKYEFRSQGNIHLLFQCESDHYHVFSFDGHKGMTYVNKNDVFVKLAKYLNQKLEDEQLQSGFSKFKLLALIEEFLEKYSIK